MAGRGDIKAGSAFVELYLKQGALTKGLLSAKKHLQSFGGGLMSLGGSLAGLGSAVLAPLGAAVSHFVSSGSALNDMSARTGVAASKLAELKFAAEQTGASLEDVEIGLKTMTRKGFKAADFDKIARSITEIEDPSERAAKSLEIFGKSGTKLIPMMADLAALRKQAQDLGLVPTDESVRQADALGDAFDQVKSSILASVFQIGAALAPVLLPALETVRGIAVSVGKWVRENGQLIRTIAMVAAGVTAAGVAITVIGGTIFGLGTVAGILAGAIGTVGTVIAALVSPFGAFVALLVGSVAAWAHFAKSGQTAVQHVATLFGDLLDVAKETFAWIADALAAGDLKLAAEVAIAGINLAWQKLASEVNKMWLDVAFDFRSTWQEAITAIAKSFTTMWAVVRQGGVEAASFAKSAWSRFLIEGENAWKMWWGRIEERQINVDFQTGKISQGERDKRLRELQDRRDTELNKSNADLAASKKQVEDDRQAALARINDDEQAALGNLDADRKRITDDMDRERKAGINQKQSALDEAQRAFDEARKRAGDAAVKAREMRALPGFGGLDLGGDKPTVTFSGTALGLAGQGGGPGQQLVKIGKEHNQKLGVIHQDLIKLADKPALVMGN